MVKDRKTLVAIRLEKRQTKEIRAAAKVIFWLAVVFSALYGVHKLVCNQWECWR